MPQLEIERNGIATSSRILYGNPVEALLGTVWLLLTGIAGEQKEGLA